MNKQINENIIYIYIYICMRVRFFCWGGGKAVGEWVLGKGACCGVQELLGFGGWNFLCPNVG